MLALAIGLGILAFVVLVFALWQGSMALAWICVGAAALGVVFSIIDLLQHRKAKQRDSEDTTV